MFEIQLENTSVEFSVKFGGRGATGVVASTGGGVDSARNVVRALADLDFHFKAGDRIGLIGHNGAGKTTMLRLLAGVYTPATGRMLRVGRVAALFDAAPGIHPDGTGRENIRICGLYLGMTPQQIKAKSDAIIEFADLGDYIDLPVRTYSTGMKMRLGFSIATSVDADILLLDEGLAAGDAQFSVKAEERMRALIERSAIVVIASHSMPFLRNTCTRCLHLEHGRIVFDGPTHDAIEHYIRSVTTDAQRSDDNVDALQHAAKVVGQMRSEGLTPPIDLEEQSLRYKLVTNPQDYGALSRYIRVLRDQGREPMPDIYAEFLMLGLSHALDERAVRKELSAFVAQENATLSADTRKRAQTAIENNIVA